MKAQDLLEMVRKKKQDCSAGIPGYAGTYQVLLELEGEIERAIIANPEPCTPAERLILETLSIIVANTHGGQSIVIKEFLGEG
jgi:hypothetical protein